MTALDADVAAELDLTIEHFNANHADTVLFVARFGGGRSDLTDAELASVDRLGVDIDIVGGTGPGRLRLDFPTEAVTTAEVRAQVLGTIAAARVTAGDDVPLTSLERELATNPTLPTLVTTVAEVRTITPNLREIVLEGGLDSFNSLGGDQFVYLMVPRADGTEVPADHTMAAQLAADAGQKPHAAYYTVRSWDAEAKRLTMWAVLHGHDDGVGGWVARAEPGERVAIWGSREGFGVQDGAERYLFVTDESGFAAVAALLADLEDAGAPVTAHVIAETVDTDHHVHFGSGHRADGVDVAGAGVGEVSVTWLHRGTDAPGTGSAMLEAVRTHLDGDDGIGLVAFGAAESRQVTGIRKFLRRELGMAATAVSMTGYWRRAAGD